MLIDVSFYTKSQKMILINGVHSSGFILSVTDVNSSGSLRVLYGKVFSSKPSKKDIKFARKIAKIKAIDFDLKDMALQSFIDSDKKVI